MTPISIPDKELPIFKAIVELDEIKLNSLIAALNDGEATLQQSAFVGQIADKVKAVLKPEEVSEIMRILFILYRMKDKRSLSVSNIAETVAKSASRDNQLSDIQRVALSERLQKLLAFDKGIAVTAKAIDVMTEHQHVFCNARVISDIRSVFADSPESASAAVLIHNLQIGFHDGGTGPHKEFYVALDTEDLRQLKEVILRAEKKTITLQGLIRSSGVPYLDSEK